MNTFASSKYAQFFKNFKSNLLNLFVLWKNKLTKYTFKLLKTKTEVQLCRLAVNLIYICSHIYLDCSNGTFLPGDLRFDIYQGKKWNKKATS